MEYYRGGTFCHVLFLAVYSLIPFIDFISNCIWKGIYRLISDCIWKAKNSNEKDKVWLLISETGIHTCSQTTAHCQCVVQSRLPKNCFQRCFLHLLHVSTTVSEPKMTNGKPALCLTLLSTSLFISP